MRFPAVARGAGDQARVPTQAALLLDSEAGAGSRAPSKTASRAVGPRVWGWPLRSGCFRSARRPARPWLTRSCPGRVDPLARLPHLRQPVALKKTSGSTTSRDTLLLPSHQPEKGTMTRSVRTGKASAMSSSFSWSVEDRFQSSPGDGDGHARPRATEGPAQPARANEPAATSPPSWTWSVRPTVPSLRGPIPQCLRRPVGSSRAGFWNSLSRSTLCTWKVTKKP